MPPTNLKIELLDEAVDFIRSLPEKARKKVTYNMLRVQNGELNDEIFKKLENTEIWEFRTSFSGMAYRLFAFWDITKNSLVVATHGIIKKTQKTPKKEIAKAERIRREYLNNI